MPKTLQSDYLSLTQRINEDSRHQFNNPKALGTNQNSKECADFFRASSIGRMYKEMSQTQSKEAVDIEKALLINQPS